MLLVTKLEHCSTVWAPFNFNTMQTLESIQGTATRYLLYYPDFKYNERCSKLKLLPLSLSEIVQIFSFKCLHRLYEVQLEDFIETNMHNRNSSLNQCKVALSAERVKFDL